MSQVSPALDGMITLQTLPALVVPPVLDVFPPLLVPPVLVVPPALDVPPAPPVELPSLDVLGLRAQKVIANARLMVARFMSPLPRRRASCSKGLSTAARTCICRNLVASKMVLLLLVPCPRAGQVVVSSAILHP